MKYVKMLLPAVLTAGALLSTLAAAPAGGFQLVVDLPPSRMQDQVALIRTYGCHEPAKANLRATAEGLVKGERVSLPVNLVMDQKGVFSIDRQWDEAGTWMLHITGRYRGHTSSVLIELDETGRPVHRGYDEKWGGLLVPRVQRPYKDHEVDAALHRFAGS